VPSVQLEEARVAICRAYGVAGVQLLLEAPEEQPADAAEALEASQPLEAAPAAPLSEAETLREQFSLRYPSAAPCLRAADFSLADNRLVLQVQESWHATRLELLKSELERDAVALLGHPVKVDITAPAVQADYEQARAARAAQLAQDWQPPVKSAPPRPRKSSSAGVSSPNGTPTLRFSVPRKRIPLFSASPPPGN
jgi:hypothetical protein